MKKLLLLTTLLFSLICLAQDYTFLPASARLVKKGELVDYLNTMPYEKHDSILKSIKRFKDDGSTYTTAYSDSIAKAKTKDSFTYTTKQYRDTISNQYYYVLHKRTKEDADADDDYWKKYFKDDEKNRKELMGSIINDLSLTDIKGNTYTSESLKGKVIILDFWFVTCAACIEEMPELNKILQEFGTDNVAYFGVTFDEKAKVERFLERVKYDYTIVADNKKLCDRMGIKFYPTTLVIDQNGKVQYTGDFMGWKEKPKELRKLLKKLTKGRK